MSSPPRVTVAVLTYKRPAYLLTMLPTLGDQVQAFAPGGRILVVDNDPDGTAREVVGELRTRGVPVAYVVEAVPGIAAARNRAVDESGSHDLLVFIDDDETPRPGWLGALLMSHARHGAAAVAGPVVSEFEAEPEAWVRAGRFFIRPYKHRAGDRLAVAATNNLLLDLAVVRKMGLRFDNAFGISGGSDTLFTRQMVRHGGEIVWCPEAVVVDRVPASRSTRSWVLRRSYRSGNVWSRTSLALAETPATRFRVRLVLAIGGGARCVGGLGRLTLGRLTRSLAEQAAGERALARGSGMLAGLMGMVYEEYARPR